jgi:hypothetical protein
VELLDPLEVDHRHHADQQVDVARDVDLVRDHRAVQAFVEQQVGAGRQSSQGGEGAGRLLVGGGLLGAVQVLAALAGAGLGRSCGTGLEFGEQVGLGPKWLKCRLPRLGLGHGARFISCRS